MKLKKAIYIIAPVIALMLSSLFYLSSVDDKIRDVLLKTGDGVCDTGDVLLVNINNYDSRNISQPFTSDVFAETLLLLNEYGAKNSIVDYGFYDESPYTLLFDYDAYLADTVKALGNISLISKFEDNPVQKKYDINFFQDKFAIQNIEIKRDTVSPEYFFVRPCIDRLSKAAMDVGFTNIQPDKDGIFRRIDLIAKYHDKYFGHAGFKSLLSVAGKGELQVFNHKLVYKVYGEENEVERKIIFPRDSSGAVLFDFPDMDFSQFNNVNGGDIYQIKLLENKLIEKIQQMEAESFFDYTPDFNSPYEDYVQFMKQKDYVYNNLNGPQDELNKRLSIYNTYKDKFYENIHIFLESSTKELLIERADDDKKIISHIEDSYKELKEQYEKIIEARNPLKKKIDGKLCIIGSFDSPYEMKVKTLYDHVVPQIGIYYIFANMILGNNKFVSTFWLWQILIISSICGALTAFVFVKIKNAGGRIFSILGIALLTVTIPYMIFIAAKLFIGVIIPLSTVIITAFVIPMLEKLSAILQGQEQ